MERVKPPRGVFINYPLGHPCGKPFDAPLQTRILKDTLNFFSTATIPGQIEDLPYQWGKDFGWDNYFRDIQDMVKEEGGQVQEWKPKEKSL